MSAEGLAELEGTLRAEMNTPSAALRIDSLVEESTSLPVIGRRTRELLESVRAFSRQDETLLITGPSGAGKSRLAAFCHSLSSRRDGPFRLVDLLSIPEEMQMAELFGWRRGAFTGALRDHDGFVATSSGGTLFLDEIDKLSLRTQAGLLQFMESRKFRALGDPGRERVANVRLIVATNVDLRERVGRGLFREDLYFRITVLPLAVSPLADRSDEIVPWTRFMLERCHAAAGERGPVTLSEEAEQALLRCEWPGNLRQLDNVVRRAYALARSTCDGEHATVCVRAAHVEHALVYEQSAPSPLRPLLAGLRRAAEELADALLQRTRESSLRLDDAQAFEGLVLQAALRRVGDLAEVYRRFGEEGLVERRNHHRHFRVQIERVKRLEQALNDCAQSGSARACGPVSSGNEADDEIEGHVDRPRLVLGGI